MSRVLRLPSRGILLVCTDLQGCLRDFESIVARFREVHHRTGDAYLLFTGDLVHGPHIDKSEWPPYLGEYYRDQSGEVMRAFAALREEMPERIFALLGNHEHGHIGGPHTAKFALDEVELLEQRLGDDGSTWLRELLQTLPLVAVAPCGAIFTHGAPAAAIQDIEDIELAELNSDEWDSPLDILDVPVVGPILWARSATRFEARRFAKALGGRFTIYGHDVIPEGFERIGDEQMIVSTSFGVFDENKVYLSLDLGRAYQSVLDLRIGHEILPLYPAKAASSLGGIAD